MKTGDVVIKGNTLIAVIKGNTLIAKRIAQLEAALRFYADEKNWDTDGVCWCPKELMGDGINYMRIPDIGAKAREALNE